MADIPEAVARLCEDPQSESPGWPGSELIRCETFDLWLGPPIYPGLSVVLRVRGEDAGALLAEVRDLLRERGRSRANWMIGSSATPPGLADELIALGLRPDTDPVLCGLVFRRRPEGVDPLIEVARANTREELHMFFRIQHEAFGENSSASEEAESSVDAMYDAERGCDYITTYIAYLDGEPVATSRATFAPAGVVMNGGSTLPRARGRGFYRALVGARWDDAVERGTPYLTTVARKSSSAPILERMGAEQVCEIRVLIDEL